jgi:hypothetical protein
MLIFGFFSLLGTINHIESTCVFDSDFGFILNCNFKKSSLFRVRNLGGVKAHFGLGKVTKNENKITSFCYSSHLPRDMKMEDAGQRRK